MLRLTTNHQPQTTIGRVAVLEGLSAGDFLDCRAELLPAPADQGIVFLAGDETIRADIENYDWNEAAHTTSLVKGDYKVSTIEHLMSAINGLGIDNLTVSLRPCGIPFNDFSAESFSRALAAAGRRQLKQRRTVIEVTEEAEIKGEDGRYLRLRPGADGGLTVRAVSDFPLPIGRMEASFREGLSDYRQDVAWARSFIASPLGAAGKKWQRIRQRFPILPENPRESPLITYDRSGFLSPLRHPDEPARHKLLDLLGDLMLFGYPLSAEIEAYKPGHRFTAEAVRQLSVGLT